MRSRLVLVVAALLALATSPALAQQVGPITFEEPEFPYGTVVNGLSVSTLGGQPIPTMTFSFAVGGSPSSDCSIDGGPGVVTYVSTPNIEGAPGTLTIDTAGYYHDVSFGFAVAAGIGGRGPTGAWTSGSSSRALGVSALAFPSAVGMTAYTSGGAAVGSVLVDAVDLPGDVFPGNRATLHTTEAFSRVVIEWNPGVFRFALDDLTLGRDQTGIPTLSASGLAVLALAILGAGFAALRFRA